MLQNENNYLGNPNLKRANVSVEWTEEQIDEYTRCMKDPLYFIENYIRIVSLDEGLVPFKMYDFQKEMVSKSIEEIYFNTNDLAEAGVVVASSASQALTDSLSASVAPKVPDILTSAPP